MGKWHFSWHKQQQQQQQQRRRHQWHETLSLLWLEEHLGSITSPLGMRQ
jgi:hypothetical protein